MKFRYLSSIVFIILPFLLSAQSVPTPGKAQSSPIVLTNATIHIGNGDVIENGSIVFTDGVISAIGTNVNQPANAQVINYTGKHIYPGIIAANTILGLSEIEALRQTRDYNEVGQFNPNVRSIIAYNTDSRVTPTLRSNGVLLAQVAPRGGSISGTSSVVQLDAWNWEDAAVHTDGGLYLNWPRSMRYSGWWAQPGNWEKRKDYDKEISELETYFAQAKAYAERNAETENLRFKGMSGVFSNTKNLFIRVDRAKEIIAAVSFAQKYDVNPIIVGGSESYLITDFLREKGVSVVLDAVHRTPTTNDTDVNLPYKIPAMLQNAGVKFCLSYADYWQVRNLPFQAGTAIAHGLEKEEGLRSITLSVAEILGIDDEFGSLEEGKSATLFVSEGDVFDMYSSNIIAAYIQGRQIDLGNKQKDLYEKFSDKYEHEIVLPEQN